MRCSVRESGVIVSLSSPIVTFDHMGVYIDDFHCRKAVTLRNNELYRITEGDVYKWFALGKSLFGVIPEKSSNRSMRWR